ncbi:hypothetical protein GCM10009525_61080 [Streptosporangium amethystogenes subsp. fukuiense]
MPHGVDRKVGQALPDQFRLPLPDIGQLTERVRRAVPYHVQVSSRHRQIHIAWQEPTLIPATRRGLARRLRAPQVSRTIAVPPSTQVRILTKSK